METVGNVNIGRRQLTSDDKVDSPNLRDLLRIKEDDNNNFSNGSNNTLNSVLSGDKRSGFGGPVRVQSNRTLLDIIREDPSGGHSKDGKRSWKHFKDKLKIRRQGSGSNWTSSVPIPASDVPIHQNSNRRMVTRRDSTRLSTSSSDGSTHPDAELSSVGPRSRSAMLQRNTSRAVERSSRRFDSVMVDDAHEDAVGTAEGEEGVGETEEEEATGEGEDGGGGGGGGEEQPVRMSLMSLLAETDRQMGLDGSAFMIEEDDDDDDEEEEKSGGDYNNCCVCMVRHKGAAFIPCGHTFCRLCSRELWVQRGNCPLCNNFILEILDIF